MFSNEKNVKKKNRITENRGGGGNELKTSKSSSVTK